MSTDTPDLLELVGTVVAEKYRVEGVVGEGGFAVVYRAEHMLWKRPVALKVFRALDDVREEDRAKLLEDFVREGALLAELSEQSTAICQARDVGMLTTPRGRELPFMVLEWLEGRSLDAVLLDEKAAGLSLRTLGETLALLAPAADALGIAHDRGIAHRDVKPANIFVLGGDARAPKVTVKLLDFGIAKVVQDAQKMAASFSKTAGQATSFTPAYGAPEQFSRQYGATGPWTDTFALALIVAEVMTGRDPLDGSDIGQLAFSSINPARRPTPRTLEAHVSDEVEAVFAKAVAVKPEERFASSRQFWSALKEASAGATAERAVVRPAAADPTRDLANAATAAVVDVSPAVASSVAATATQPLVGGSGSPPPEAALDGPAGKSPRSRSRRPLLIALAVGAVAVVVGLARRDQPMVADPAVPATSASPAASASDHAKSTAASRHGAPAGSAHDGKAASGQATGETCPSGTRKLPAGNLIMGIATDESVNADEKPSHKVTFSHALCLDVQEVTVAQYRECVENRDCEHSVTNEWPGITRAQHETYDPLCNARDPMRRGDYPINCVDWRMANAYCQYRGMRLPTEAEWELAARPSATHKYPWGDGEPGSLRTNACGAECERWKLQNHAEEPQKKMYPEDDGYETTAPVGVFPAGATSSGFVDMFGNVSEWVEDVYAPYVPGKDGEALVDPRGPPVKPGEKDEDVVRVVRGGAWNSYAVAWLRPTYRDAAVAKRRSHGTGFRCAQTVR